MLYYNNLSVCYSLVQECMIWHKIFAGCKFPGFENSYLILEIKFVKKFIFCVE